MVWGAFSGTRKSSLVVLYGDPEAKRGGVSGRQYKATLEDELPLIMLDDTYIFMQANAGIHRYRPLKRWFKEINYTIMKWPAYSPDLNPIEYVWVKIKELLYKNHPEVAAMTAAAPKVKEAIGKALSDCWDEIPDTYFDNLIESMP